MPQVYQTSISIGGQIDPSLLKTLGYTQKQVQGLQKSMNLAAASGRQFNQQLTILPGKLQAANNQVTKMHQGLGHLGRILENIVVYGGLFGMIRGISRATDKMGELLEKSLQVSAAFERQQWAIGNITGDRGVAAKLSDQLSKLGSLSGLGANNVMESAKQLSAFGIPSKNLTGTTQLIAAASELGGGNQKDFEFLTEAYGKVETKGYLEKRGAATFGEHGIPMMAELVKLYGGSGSGFIPGKMAGKGGEFFKGTPEQYVQELISKQKITAAMFQRALIDMVNSAGGAAAIFKSHSETFSGSVGVFQSNFEEFERYLGKLEEEALAPLIAWFNNSGVWDYAQQWLTDAKSWVDGAVSYFKTADIAGKLQPAFDSIQVVWARFNSFLDNNVFFTFTNPATGDIEKGMRPGTVDSIQKVLDQINKVVSEFVKFSTSPEVLTLAKDTTSLIVDVVKQMFRGLEEIATLYTDVKKGDLGKFISDFKKYEFDNTPAARDTLRDHLWKGPLGIPWGPSDPDKVNHGWWDHNGKISSGVTGSWGDSIEKNTDHLDDLNQSIQDLNNYLSGVTGPGASGSSGSSRFGGDGGWRSMRYGGGSSLGLTEYGHVPGDQPGGPTFDRDSWNGIGHIHGVRYNLNTPGPQPMAMHPEHAARFYPGLQPGGTFRSKRDNQLHRWMDTTGGGPENEDRYHGAQINYSPTYNISGDSDHIFRVIKERSSELADHVHREIRDKISRSAIV